mgnify:CR=1 FL=1
MVVGEMGLVYLSRRGKMGSGAAENQPKTVNKAVCPPFRPVSLYVARAIPPFPSISSSCTSYMIELS